MKLECVLVCVNYSDYLSCVLPQNKKHFDNIIIVTTEKDKATINLCKEHGIEPVLTNRLYEGGAKFNKGKAVNDGIKKLKFNDWVLITDADMLMTNNFRERLNSQNLDTESIYGTHRYMCPTNEDWKKFNETKVIGDGWVLQKHRLAIGVGFFQLVNTNSIIMRRLNPKWYSEDYGHAGRSDRVFLRNWPDKLRHNLRYDVIHLGSDELGKNWNGRVTGTWND
jgi:hypothetical protein